MYEIKDRVRFSEVDGHHRLTMTAIVNYMQDCCTFQSEDIGYGLDYLSKNRKAWIMAAWHVKVHRYPKFGEQIAVQTLPYRMDHFIGLRAFRIIGEDGHEAVLADSKWLYYDYGDGAPKEPPQAMIDGYRLDPRPGITCDRPRRIILPESMKTADPFHVRKTDIDLNGHVNNAAYVRMAEEYLPNGIKAAELRIEYRHAAKFGCMIYPSAGTDGDWLSLALNDGDGKPFALAEMRMVSETEI